MYDPNSKIIKQYTTPIDENGEHREYVVYKKDALFVTECIEWRIKSRTTSGGSQEYYTEFDSEKDALEKYNEILLEWESKK